MTLWLLSRLVRCELGVAVLPDQVGLGSVYPSSVRLIPGRGKHGDGRAAVRHAVGETLRVCAGATHSALPTLYTFPHCTSLLIWRTDCGAGVRRADTPRAERAHRRPRAHRSRTQPRCGTHSPLPSPALSPPRCVESEVQKRQRSASLCSTGVIDIPSSVPQV